jgi:hypothetical protein
VLDRVVFTDFILVSVYVANSRLAKVKTAKFAAQQTNKQAVNLSVHQDDGRPCTWNPEIPDKDVDIAEFSVSCHQGKVPRSRLCIATST